MGEVLYAAPQFAPRPVRERRLGDAARILIVDSDPASLAAIAQALQNEGHCTATAFDAAGAAAIVERLGPFNLVITDVQTTAAQGIELSETLGARSRELQVLCLAKPFSESQLLNAVASCLYWTPPRRPR